MNLESIAFKTVVTFVYFLNFYIFFGYYFSQGEITTAKQAVASIFTFFGLMGYYLYLKTCNNTDSNLTKEWNRIYPDLYKRYLSLTDPLPDSTFKRSLYCDRCQSLRPPGCNHSSPLGCCVVRYDHYCMWTCNAIGASNYKFFILFKFYSAIGCVINSVAVLSKVLKFEFKHLLNARKLIYSKTYIEAFYHLRFVLVVIFGLAVSIAVAVALLSFVCYSMCQVAKGVTYLESLKNKEGTYSWANIRAIFGQKASNWLLPVTDYSEEKAITALIDEMEASIKKSN